VVAEQSLREWDWTFDANNDPAVLPAFVLGYELGRGIVEEPPLAPSWVVRIGHQHGGYACLQANIVGVFFPLAENRAKAKRDLPPFEAALRIMTDEYDSDRVGVRRGLADFEALANVRATHGGALTWRERDAPDALLRAYFDVPALTESEAESHEALLRFGPVDLLTFSGFVARDFVASSNLPTPCYALPAGTTQFDTVTAQRLASMKTQLEHPAPAALFLLWLNSD
jgi:hypothetical protein